MKSKNYSSASGIPSDKGTMRLLLPKQVRDRNDVSNKLLNCHSRKRSASGIQSPLLRGVQGCVKKDSGQAGMTDKSRVTDLWP
jgi:hypothetical protein